MKNPLDGNTTNAGLIAYAAIGLLMNFGIITEDQANSLAPIVVMVIGYGLANKLKKIENSTKGE